MAGEIFFGFKLVLMGMNWLLTGIQIVYGESEFYALKLVFMDFGARITHNCQSLVKFVPVSIWLSLHQSLRAFHKNTYLSSLFLNPQKVFLLRSLKKSGQTHISLWNWPD